MAENRVIVEGTWPPGTSIPVTVTSSFGGVQDVRIVAENAATAIGAPLATNIVAGSVDGDQTIISLTGGQVWYGFFTLAATLIGTSKTSTVMITNLGGTATPASSVELLSLDLATGVTDDNVSQTITSPYMYIYAGASDNDVHVTVVGSPMVLSATAYGYILP